MSGRLGPTEAAVRTQESSYPAPACGWCVLGVLTLAYLFSFLDRQIISFLVRPSKRDFGLSNFQIGLLHGPTFAVFYTLFGLPVGRWAGTRSWRGLFVQ